jgi:hypothetical protein
VSDAVTLELYLFILGSKGHFDRSVPMTTMSFNSVYIYLFIYFVDHNLKMATYLRLLSVLLVLSIVGDILHIKDVWFDGGVENGNSLGKLKYSLLLPGAESYAGLAKSAIKAAKKVAKAQAKKKGNARNKQKQRGLSIF